MLTRKYPSGFTLVEMAMVLMIVGLLLGGLIPSLSAQIEAQRTGETRKQLDEIQQALIGYAIVYGRLPCPASSSSNGVESFVSGGSPSDGRCSNFYDGFVPSATLGLTTTDSSGFAVDGWNNRIRYAVTQANGRAFTTTPTPTSGMSYIGISNLLPDLLVCASAAPATGFSATSCGSASNALTSSPGVPVVIYSTGKNGGTGTDEAANSSGSNRTFVSHTPTGSPNEFDDLVIWLSPNILINRMVAAGKLP